MRHSWAEYYESSKVTKQLSRWRRQSIFVFFMSTKNPVGGQLRVNPFENRHWSHLMATRFLEIFIVSEGPTNQKVDTWARKVFISSSEAIIITSWRKWQAFRQRAATEFDTVQIKFRSELPHHQHRPNNQARYSQTPKTFVYGVCVQNYENKSHQWLTHKRCIRKIPWLSDWRQTMFDQWQSATKVLVRVRFAAEATKDLMRFSNNE